MGPTSLLLELLLAIVNPIKTSKNDLTASLISEIF